VLSFVRKHLGKPQAAVRLSTGGFPKKVILEFGGSDTKSLAECSLTKNEALIVEVK
jgi:hypothetical protein